MGDDAARREASAEEIEQMQAIVRDAMAHGAVGFASSTSPAHNGEGGLPMPSRLASDAEMAALVAAMGEGGRGVYMLTKGAHTQVSFLELLAATTGRPVMVAALLHNSVAPRAVFDDLDAIAAANARGHRLLGQVSCCALTMDFTAGVALSRRRSGELEAGARHVRAPSSGGARRPRVPRRRPRRAEDGDDVSPLQQRMGQGPCRRDGSAGSRAPRAAQHRRRSPPKKAATRSTRCSTSPSPTT
jgi:hypothetical protein